MENPPPVEPNGAYTRDLGSCAARRPGSSPGIPTIIANPLLREQGQTGLSSIQLLTTTTYQLSSLIL